MLNRAIRSCLTGMAVWLVVCTAGGYSVLAYLGEYGSVLQFVTGGVMGLLGAGTLAVLCFSPRFRSLGFIHRAVLNWLSAYLLFTALAILLTNFKMAQFNPDFWPDFFRFILLYTGAPMLLISMLVGLVTGIRRLRA